MDDKENSSGAAALAKEGTPGAGRSRKGGASKLRKSLAWNNAFFTEEGVLDPSELSMLNGQATKSSASFLSPFTSKILGSSNKSQLLPIEESSGSRSPTLSRSKGRNTGALFPKPVSSTRDDPSANMTQVKVSVGKSNCKNTTRPTAVNSKQKRLANASMGNPASKIPKLRGGNSSLPASSKSVAQTTKGSKNTQTASPVKVQQNVGPKNSLLNIKKGISKVKSSAHNTGKDTVSQISKPLISSATQTPRYGSDSGLFPRPPLPTNLPTKNSLPESGKPAAASQIAQKAYQAPSAQLAKPSALRMPSPSLGYFLQGKSSSLHADAVHSQGNEQQSLTSESNHQSLRKPYSRKNNGEMRTLHLSNGKRAAVDSTVTNNTDVVVGCTKVFSAENHSTSSIPSLKMNPAIKSSTESTRMLVNDSSVQRSSKYQEDDKKLLMVDNNTDKQTGKQTKEMCGPDDIEQACFQDGMPAVANNALLVNGLCEKLPIINDCGSVDDRDLATNAKESVGDRDLATNGCESVKVEGIFTDGCDNVKVGNLFTDICGSTDVGSLITRDSVGHGLAGANMTLEKNLSAQASCGNSGMGGLHLHPNLADGDDGTVKNNDRYDSVQTESSLELGKAELISPKAIRSLEVASFSSENEYSSIQAGNIENTIQVMGRCKSICHATYDGAVPLLSRESDPYSRLVCNINNELIPPKDKDPINFHDEEEAHTTISDDRELLHCGLQCEKGSVTEPTEDKIDFPDCRMEIEIKNCVNSAEDGVATSLEFCNEPRSAESRSLEVACSSTENVGINEVLPPKYSGPIAFHSEKETHTTIFEDGDFLDCGLQCEEMSVTACTEDKFDFPDCRMEIKNSVNSAEDGTDTSLDWICREDRPMEPRSLDVACSSTKNVGSFVEASNLVNSIPGVGHSGPACGVSYGGAPSTSAGEINPVYGLMIKADDETVLANDSCPIPVHNEEECCTMISKHNEFLDHGLEHEKMTDSLPRQDEDDLPDCETQCEIKNSMNSAEYEVAVCVDNNRSMDISKQSPPLKYPPKAEPFTEEWIAAVEAFGEDILKMKTGAVQNSPPDKSMPEPSPWSPVKRKNQDLGPYDCTKYTKDLHPPAPS